MTSSRRSAAIRMAVRVRGGPLCVGTLGLLLALAGPSASASAAQPPAPRWAIVSTSNPTTFVPGGTTNPQLVITATNVGGAATDGTEVTISDSLPAGLRATSVVGFDAYRSGVALDGEPTQPGPERALSCSPPPVVRCTASGPFDPGDALIVTVRLAPIGAPLVGLSSFASVAGGGAGAATVREDMTSGGAPAQFGFVSGGVLAGTSSSQAGAHPNVTTAFTLNTRSTDEVAAYPKDVRFKLPPGLVGSTVGLPRCPTKNVVEQLRNPNACPVDTMVGMAIVRVTGTNSGKAFSNVIVVPIYNVAPNSGEPAAFALNAFFFPVRLDTRVLPDGSYAVEVAAADIPQTGETVSTQVTFWGVPVDHSGRGRDVSFYNLLGGGSFGGLNTALTRTALLTAPQQCSEPLLISAVADSWASPGAFVSSEQASMGTPTGCDALRLEPTLRMLPDTLAAGAPAGYALDLEVPQSAGADALATPNLKGVTLTLPAGTAINPSVANGLGACTDAQFGLGQSGASSCPASARLGAVEVLTPALALPLKGTLYVGEPECNPCSAADAEGGRLVRLFLEVENEGEQPVIVKLQGRGRLDARTGQITTAFQNLPQLPFSELRLKLNGGDRAPLVNPRGCGTVTTTSDIVPWSTPYTPDATPSSSFVVGGCASPVPFGPLFSAGTVGVGAGASSPFTLTLSRSDGEQDFAALSTTLPPGLVGLISQVPLCAEPLAAVGACPEVSRLGSVTVAAGVGSQPLWLSGGVYLTGPYNGAPFGLSVVVPAKAGPFNLGNVVVRAALTVDSHSGAVTVTSGPLPQIVGGVPVRLRTVNVRIDRPGFMLSPTGCEALSVTGLVAGAQGARAAVSSPFAVTGCAGLPFSPSFTASTSARTSRANGASLDVRVAFPAGRQANIRSVRVSLPVAMPSRLTTLQKACVAAVFDANPGSCPAESVVGIARAQTPVLAGGLVGPAFLVSHGGRAFPDLVVVLQGQGVRVDLVGNTDIKRGVTSSTFASVPDVPVSSFELYLPAGRYSALGAFGSFCGRRLVMPTTILAQNGAVIRQATRIRVAGCPRRQSARKASGAGHRLSARRAKRVERGRSR